MHFHNISFKIDNFTFIILSDYSVFGWMGVCHSEKIKSGKSLEKVWKFISKFLNLGRN